MTCFRFQRYALAVGFGGLQAWALSYPFGGNWSALLQLLSMFACLLLMQKKATFQTAWLFATSWLCGTVWWLYIALHTFGQLPILLTLIAIGLLCGGLALYYAAAVQICQWASSGLHPVWQGVVFAASWTAAEMARAQWFTGFPWGAIGYAHVQSWLSALAPWTGVYGIGFAAALISAWMAWISQHAHPRWRWLCCLGLLAALPMDMPKPENTGSTLSVALFQGNIAQDLKFASGREDALNWYLNQLMQSHAQVSVLPETAIPYFKEELPGNYWETIAGKFASGQQAALIGIPTRDREKGYGNSAIALGMEGEPTQYNKHHLVPFGEFTPAMFRWFTNLLALGFADFNRGPAGALPFAWKGNQLAVNICYEDLFGEELAKSYVANPLRVPTMMVNISNIAWFGHTVVIPQHLQIARMRSLEFQTPTIRATNSGGTAIINAQGVIIDQLEPYTRDVLVGEVPTRPGVITPYAYWAGHWGLKPMWGWCLGIMLFGLFKNWRWLRSQRTVPDQ